MGSSSLPHQRPTIGFSSLLNCGTGTWFFTLLLLVYALYTSRLLLSDNFSSQCRHIAAISNLSYSAINSSQLIPDPIQQKNHTRAMLLQKPQPPQHITRGTEINHVVFCIAASAGLWEQRKEYIKLWWRPNQTRGVVWLEKDVPTKSNEHLPEIRVSENTSDFKYTHPHGRRAAIRLTRVISETLRLGLKDVRWFVMGDDDTVFVIDNLIRILNKYDHKQFYYIGSPSESHIQDIFFSYGMAFGGGGFAISYPLAKEIEKMQDRCLHRYPGLFGSDDRIQACVSEIGVPLTKEPGFHQCDMYGNIVGFLGAHPVTPLVTMHHIDFIDPIFPRMTRTQALHHLFQSVNQDSASVLQQSICYDSKRQWSISLSWGYVIQVVRGIISPRELEMPMRTFMNWVPRGDFLTYSFNSRPITKHPCQKPFLYYMTSSMYHPSRKQVVGVYKLDRKDPHPFCKWRTPSPESIHTILVMKRPDPQRWEKSPRRDCCRVLPSNKMGQINIWVGNCREGEVSEL
ncbi:uncharacterized protein LOC124939292 [Impatiens glandulifera]|uniref:uncharacterized protein LOC124939292 n=1 Tax=Impatiens glandulifera TaxID=253017 RepID=UPI001FB16F94|nr:uncharacterized protein LOC124939292 [Impatiens glandulifera]